MCSKLNYSIPQVYFYKNVGMEVVCLFYQIYILLNSLQNLRDNTWLKEFMWSSGHQILPPGIPF